MSVVWFGIVLLFAVCADASPIDYLLFDDFDDEESQDPSQDQDYDLHYDQRQNGTGNIRLNIDGVIIGMPSSASSSAGTMMGSLASNYLLDLVAAHKDDDDSDEDNDKYEYEDDKPYEFESISNATSAGAPNKEDETGNVANGNSEDFKPVAVINSQQIVEIKPTTTTTEKPSTAEAVYERRNPNGGRRGVVKKGKNAPRRRNKYAYL